MQNHVHDNVRCWNITEFRWIYIFEKKKHDVINHNHISGIWPCAYAYANLPNRKIMK